MIRFLSAVLIVAACGRPSVPPLRETAAALQQAFTARDPDRIASFFAVDAVAMYPLPQPIVGREANRGAWASYFSRRSAHPVTVDSVVVAASGDLGYTLGRYLTAEARDPGATGGRYVIVWRKIDDQWRIAILSAHDYADITAATFAPR